jgi:hypothetical protein
MSTAIACRRDLDASGNQCVCMRGIWYCTTSCASAYSTPPVPNSACARGAVCNYSSGVSCECVNTSWMCMGASACPAVNPMTGDACNNLTGVECDYPNSSPALHMVCLCTGNPDAGTGSTWTCMQLGACPMAQPAYSLTNLCPGVGYCSYGSTYCSCLTSSTPWICGLGAFMPSFTIEVTPAAG